MASVIDKNWSPRNINLLIDKRIKRDVLFKTTNSDKIGWIQVVADMKKSGGSTTLNRINVKRQWIKLCETFKKLNGNNEDLEKQIINYPYYEKLRSFFVDKMKRQINAPENDEKKFTRKFLIVAPYSERWNKQKSELLINRRIARNKLFEKVGRGSVGYAWQTVLADLVSLGAPETTTVVQLQKKWEYICAKYRKLKTGNSKAKEWPYFMKLDNFFNKSFECDTAASTFDQKEQSDESTSLVILAEPYECTTEDSALIQNECRKVGTYGERWTIEQTTLLIKRRIIREAMFDGRGLSTSGWKAVLSDLKQAGAPEDLTASHVRKKWNNICCRYKVIKDSNCINSSWPYFEQMDNYLGEKYRLKKQNSINTEKVEEMSQESCVIVKLDFEETKMSQCRLCQQRKSEHFLANKNLCERIIECTSLKILENAEYLPPGLCGICKTTIDTFYEFLIRCREVDKELRDSIPVLHVDKDKKQTECSPTDTYECTECPASFTSIDMLVNHLKSHKESYRFHCEVCSRSFTKQSALYSHIKRHLTISNLAIEEQTNEKIDYVNSSVSVTNESSSIDNVENNIDTEILDQCEKISEPATKPPIFTCDLCLKTFTEKTLLQNHIETHSRTVHVCPREDCNKSFVTISSLRNHERKHSGTHSFLCMVCGKAFVTNNALKLHEKIHSEIKEYICDMCSLGFSVMSNLRAHQKKHHEGHRFYCSQCPKEFLTKSSLQRHELVHTGVKEFVCDTCSSAFYTSKELLKHKRYHDGVRLYHCNQCFKAFYEKHHLTVHLRCHTGERPYPCSVPGCAKSFKESQKLSRHVKIHHKINK